MPGGGDPWWNLPQPPGANAGADPVFMTTADKGKESNGKTGKSAKKEIADALGGSP